MGASTEFQTVEGFYEPEAAGLFFSVGPTLLAMLALAAVAVFLLGWWWGQRTRPADDPAESIYLAVRKAVDAAVGAPRDHAAARARALHAAIETHLGEVLTLSRGVVGPFDAIGAALDDRPAPANAHPHPAPAPRGAENVIINAGQVTVQAGVHQHGEEAHGEPAGHAARDDHGPAPSPPDAKTQLARLRGAVHAFADHWSDKPRRLDEIRAARRRLSRMSALPKSHGRH